MKFSFGEWLCVTTRYNFQCDLLNCMRVPVDCTETHIGDMVRTSGLVRLIDDCLMGISTIAALKGDSVVV